MKRTMTEFNFFGFPTEKFLKSADYSAPTWDELTIKTTFPPGTFSDKEHKGIQPYTIISFVSNADTAGYCRNLLFNYLDNSVSYHKVECWLDIVHHFTEAREKQLELFLNALPGGFKEFTIKTFPYNFVFVTYSAATFLTLLKWLEPKSLRKVGDLYLDKAFKAASPLEGQFWYSRPGRKLTFLPVLRSTQEHFYLQTIQNWSHKRGIKELTNLANINSTGVAAIRQVAIKIRDLAAKELGSAPTDISSPGPLVKKTLMKLTPSWTYVPEYVQKMYFQGFKNNLKTINMQGKIKNSKYLDMKSAYLNLAGKVPIPTTSRWTYSTEYHPNAHLGVARVILTVKRPPSGISPCMFRTAEGRTPGAYGIWEDIVPKPVLDYLARDPKRGSFKVLEAYWYEGPVRYSMKETMDSLIKQKELAKDLLEKVSYKARGVRLAGTFFQKNFPK